jgi:isopenicillin-N N-acyltransferase like protein
LNFMVLLMKSAGNNFELLSSERDMLLHSNHYLTERFKGVDTAPQYQPDSYSRLDIIRSLMDHHYGHLNIEIMKQTMGDHENHPNSICRHIDPMVPISSTTLASFIMVPVERAIYIATGHPCEHEYVRYEF